MGFLHACGRRYVEHFMAGLQEREIKGGQIVRMKIVKIREGIQELTGAGTYNQYLIVTA